MVVMLVPQHEPPLHAMVAKGGDVAAISAFDIQCTQGQNEAKVTIDDFHSLLACDFDASERTGRGEPLTALKAQDGFQKSFDSALRESRGVRKMRLPSMPCSMGCFRAQKDEPDDHLYDSLEKAHKAFLDKQESFHRFLELCERELHQALSAAADPRLSIISTPSVLSSISSQAGVQAEGLVSLRNDVAAMAKGLRSDGAGMLMDAASAVENAARQGLEEKMKVILSEFHFDDATKTVFEEGIEDIVKSLVRKHRR